jgi:nitroimidazol reductase NimA-like FMN-containing flavoprotein (pyridoxamine 5'-phosphate oxidase superfamily)
MRYRDNMDGTTNPLSGAEAAAALALLREAGFAYLAMAEPQGPYVLPLNFVYIEDGGGTPGSAAAPAAGSLTGRIYFHTGEGRKTAALAADPRVCLAATAGVAFHQGDSPCADSFSYRSLLLWGQAHRIDDPARREAALRAIVAKYDPEAATKPFGKADFARTILFEMIIEAASYKQEPAGAAG